MAIWLLFVIAICIVSPAVGGVLLIGTAVVYAICLAIVLWDNLS